QAEDVIRSRNVTGVQTCALPISEDGMPAPRAVCCSIALTPNFAYNGGLMVMPGSHRTFVPSLGETPEDNHKSSLKEQKIGVPSEIGRESCRERGWRRAAREGYAT